MRVLPLGLFRGAIFSCFVFLGFCLVVLLNTGCSPGKLTIGVAGPTPTPGNAFVFTANAGGNNISGFSNDGAGNLTVVPGSPFASPGEPFGLAATPNNAFLYVSSFLNAQVTGFSINATTGTLTPLACPVATTGSQPLKVAINPAGTFLFTANQVGSVTGFAINASGCLTAISTTATDSVARGLTIDGSGQFLYVVTGGGGIDLFTINSDGTLARQVIGGFDSTTGTMLAVKAVPGINVLLATDGGSTNNLRSFVINTFTGALTPIVVTVAGSSPPNPSAIAVNTPANATTPLFYVANTASNNLTVNTVAADGTSSGASALTVPASTGPIDLAVDPTGRFLYVANNGASTVTAFNANITAANVNSAIISFVATGSAPESIVVVGHP